MGQLDRGDIAGFRATLDQAVPLARPGFRAPTQHCRTGVAFLAWLDGFQGHFVMLGGARAMRPPPCFCDVFRRAHGCGPLRTSELAVAR